jgi:hypothetical protein
LIVTEISQRVTRYSLAVADGAFVHSARPANIIASRRLGDINSAAIPSCGTPRMPLPQACTHADAVAYERLHRGVRPPIFLDKLPSLVPSKFPPQPPPLAFVRHGPRPMPSSAKTSGTHDSSFVEGGTSVERPRRSVDDGHDHLEESRPELDPHQSVIETSLGRSLPGAGRTRASLRVTTGSSAVEDRLGPRHKKPIRLVAPAHRKRDHASRVDPPPGQSNPITEY